MSLIEKAAERFEKERIAKAKGRAQAPRDQVAGKAAPDRANEGTPPSRAAEDVANPEPSRPTASAPAATDAASQSRSVARSRPSPPAHSTIPAHNTVEQTVSRGQQTDANLSPQSASQSFRLNFKDLEKRGFICRPFTRGRLAEDLRLMKHRLMNRMNFFSLDADRQPGRQQNVIMVTSSWASEGKTFTATNLALSLALEDRVSVLLVDADVIRPAVHSIFGLPVADGLTDYLRVHQTELSPYLWRAENAPLAVLPAGGPIQSSRELFRSDDMSRFIYDVSNRYSDRLVIVDTPPLLVTAEAPVLANHADQIIVVVHAGRTPQSALEDALDLLPEHDNVSLVLNRCNEGERLTMPEYYNYGLMQDPDSIESLRNQS